MKYLPQLRYSIPAVLGVLGLTLVFLAFFDGVQRTEQLIESEARVQLLTFGTRLAARLEQMYASHDSRGVRDLLMRTASEPHLRKAAVIDAQGRVDGSADLTLLDKSLSEFAPPTAISAWQQSIASRGAIQIMDADRTDLVAIFPFSLPPNRGELRSQRYAALYLVTDLSETKRLNWARHVERAWLMAGVVAFALAIVWIYFNWAVTKRLERLSAAMQRAASNEETAGDIMVSGHDEVGRLSAGFAAMLAEIRHRSNALVASEERHRSVVQAMSEGVVMFDSKGQIIAANDSAGRALGITHDEITARTVFDPHWRVHHEDGRPMSVEEYPPVVTLRTCAASENVIIGVSRPDGELRWVSINCAPIWLDATHREWGAVTTVNDITERRKVELQARRDRERLAAIVDSAMDGVVSTDSEMRITVFNRAAEKMFGRSERAMLGQPLDALLPVRFRSAHRDLMQSFATSGLAKRAMGVPGQVTGMRADGEEFPLEASIARVSVGDETILTVILRDISERVRAEEQRLQLEGQLRQSQKMQSLGTLTGGIAHDFNNILTAITGNAKLAIDDLPRTHPVQRSLVEIDKAAARATNLVRQVLAFGRRQEAQRVAVDMAAVVGEALNFLRAMIPTTIDIRSRFAEHLPRVAADKTQVHQVITNLGSNAAHAIGDRPGFIDVSLDEVRITEAEAQRSLDLDAGLYLRLSFSDNGDGIESAVLDRIFEPFFTTKSLGQGTGLGLSVVHGIMKNHDGSISVHSTRGAGTRFDLYFPGCAQASATAPIEMRRPLDDANTGRGKTVIYVDDEEALVFLVTRILERRGYQVLGFNQPRHALAELTKNPQRIDALISDLAMPGMTGFDVAREAFALRPDLPIIVVSGYIRPQDATTAHALGVQRMILKPDTVDALAAALHEVLEASERVNAS